MHTELLKAGIRTFLSRFATPVRFRGDSEAISSAVIERLWNGVFYETGLRHFGYFWMRDFGSVIESLIELGHQERAVKTLRWALDNYLRADEVSTCIGRNGRTFEAPLRSIDALPWLMNAIVVTNLPLASTDRSFLQEQLDRYSSAFLDQTTGLIRTDVDFSELRDAVKYHQSAYAVCMLALIARCAATLRLTAPLLQRTDYKAVLIERYWNGEYFDADLESRAFSAECNLFPLWLGIVDDFAKCNAVLATIKKKNLTNPYPIHYTDEPSAFTYRWWARVIMPDYASTTIWTWHGALYLQLLYKANHPSYREEREKFDSLIERYGTFPELLNADGSWYKTPFYQSEEGMVWAALYLTIVQKR